VQALLKEDNPFSGVLYGGFIKTNKGVKVIEYNARFGDPETECVLNNLSSDLVQHILDLLENKPFVMSFKKTTSVGLVLSAPGYPLSYQKDIDLTSYLLLPLKMLHMQTKKSNDIVLSNGGRVLFILSEGDNAQEGFNKIYSILNKQETKLLHYRHDLNNY
jgi:phosphoribosylamine--glycine ligase